MAHYVKRFFGSLLARRPTENETQWVRGYLSEEEFALWNTQSREDKRHSIRVGKRVESAHLEPWTVVAGLLHDVGKTRSSLGTFGRSVATVVALTLKKRRVATWSWRSGWRGEFGKYVAHGSIGAELLGGAGSDELVIAWTRQHAWPLRLVTLPPEVSSVLRNADRA